MTSQVRCALPIYRCPVPTESTTSAPHSEGLAHALRRTEPLFRGECNLGAVQPRRCTTYYTGPQACTWKLLVLLASLPPGPSIFRFSLSGRGMLTMLAFIFGAAPDDGREMVGAPRVRRAGSPKASNGIGGSQRRG